MFLLFLLIPLLASTIGSIVGAGGGVIIKPVLDMLGVMPVKTLSFCSGCAVLSMSVASLIRGRNDDVKLGLKVSTSLATGAVFGGIIGKVDFLQRELLSLFNHHLLYGFRHSWIHGCKIRFFHDASFHREPATLPV